MRTMGRMADTENPSSDGPGPNPSEQAREQSATRDLAEGLDLMLRAAKKAMRNVEAQNLEALGRRALDNLEALNKKRVEDLKHKARRTLDPRRIEEIAEDAGKELVRVVERVVERVDSIVTRGPTSSGPTAKSEPPSSSEQSPSAPGDRGEPEDAQSPTRVRVEDD